MKIYRAFFKNWNLGEKHLGYFSSEEKANKALGIFAPLKRDGDEDEKEIIEVDKMELVI